MDPVPITCWIYLSEDGQIKVSSWFSSEAEFLSATPDMVRDLTIKSPRPCKTHREIPVLVKAMQKAYRKAQNRTFSGG